MESARALSVEASDSFAALDQARIDALKYSGLGQKSKAAEQAMLAALIVRRDGIKIFGDRNMIGLWKMEWGFCVSAYKYDSSRKDAFQRANELFFQIQKEEGKQKEDEGKKKEVVASSDLRS